MDGQNPEVLLTNPSTTIIAYYACYIRIKPVKTQSPKTANFFNFRHRNNQLVSMRQPGPTDRLN